jgi:hypothetical protein
MKAKRILAHALQNCLAHKRKKGRRGEGDEGDEGVKGNLIYSSFIPHLSSLKKSLIPYSVVRDNQAGLKFFVRFL